ncbi:hypothetical protein [Butyrivibrio sp. AE3004]|uniref:hypothetical protein n=1 Tax=Butyrivibrio sp. AE3004 TaxID=1506994 RepID=UPI0006917442|nr:hypothetical protein [Butyrivibrio sp. AE3004]
MEEKMRKIGRQMGIRMGILMSFCLALVGTLTSGHFTVFGFIISFILSSVISLLIGFFIPVGKISGDVCRKLRLERGKIGARLVETLISDLIYTPIITLAMVALAYNMAMKQSGGMAEIRFLPMFFSSLIICFVAAFILIFIFMPMILKHLMKKNDLV